MDTSALRIAIPCAVEIVLEAEVLGSLHLSKNNNRVLIRVMLHLIKLKIASEMPWVQKWGVHNSRPLRLIIKSYLPHPEVANFCRRLSRPQTV
jgi:hypothetical protein